MNLLLDESVPRRLARAFPEPIERRTIQDMDSERMPPTATSRDEPYTRLPSGR